MISTIGDVLHRKKEILARLSGIQKSSRYPTSVFLQDLEHNVTYDYNNILKLMKIIGNLDHINWLSKGDANTKFFHVSVLNKRRKPYVFLQR